MAVVGFTGGAHADVELGHRLRAAGAHEVHPTMLGLAEWLGATAIAPA